MRAPENPAAGGGDSTPLSGLLRRNLAASALIFFLLQLWRPCFFLTDDNLTGGYSSLIEIGHHLLAGRSPFYSDYVFGGHYNMLRDPAFFAWNPLYLLVSLLAGTPWSFLIVDVITFFLFMLTTAGFVLLAQHLRREGTLPISDGWITFYTLSFVYSLIALTTAASWFTFECNESALPFLALGILQKNWRRSLGLIALFSVHQWLGGHLSPSISTSLLFTLFAFGVSLSRRSIQPLACWMIGSAVALIFILPLLLPASHGFFASTRSLGVSVEAMRANNIWAPFFPMSLFGGIALWMIHPPDFADRIYQSYTVSMGACAAAWCLIPALANLKKWNGLEITCGAMLFLIALLIIRPVWLAEIMIRLPLLKSMRWPFREFVQFQFFLHLFLLIRRPVMSLRIRQGIAFFGALLVVVPTLLYYTAPTLNAMRWDRHLILSGKTDLYWTKVRALLKPDDRVAVVIPLSVYTGNRFVIPFSLLNTYDYPMMTRVINVAGYSPTVPNDQLYTLLSDYPFGAFVPEQKEALLRQLPGLKFITLEGLRPLKITLSSTTGPTTDLTALIPDERISP